MSIWRKDPALRRNPAKLARFRAEVRAEYERAAAAVDSAARRYKEIKKEGEEHRGSHS